MNTEQKAVELKPRQTLWGVWLKESFYVTAINGKRVHWLAGPYRSEREARGRVADIRGLGEEADPFSTFFAWGVTGIRENYARKTPLGAV